MTVKQGGGLKVAIKFEVILYVNYDSNRLIFKVDSTIGTRQAYSMS